VLGTARALPLLNALMTNAPAGQQAVGEGAVPWQVRAHAAIALGLTNEPLAVDPLLEVVGSSAGNQQELRVAAVLALGMMRNERSLDALGGLLKVLDDHKTDTLVRAAIPTAVARLGDATLVPRLLAVYADADTDQYVRQSLIIAFGTLADLGQPGVLGALSSSLTDDSDAATRHFAAISLARVGARSRDPALADVRRDVERLLRRELMDPSHRADRGWIALAAALYGRAQPPAQAMFTEILTRTYDKEHDPSNRGAIALGLGLIGAKEMAPRLLEDFTRSDDDSFRGYAAVSLGLLRFHEAAIALRPLCGDPTVSDTLRQQVVRGLTLMDDPQLIPVLLSALAEAETVGVAWSVSRALGLRRDGRSVEPLLELALDSSRSVPARAFACVALGLVGDKAELRFNADLARDCNYLLLTTTLQDIFSL
jgi:HEAT repeat protein